MKDYSWKVNLYPNVPAQSAGEELERIHQKNGQIKKADIVEESKPETAVLHPCFEWNDERAAKLYRERQAGTILCNIRVKVIDDNTTTQEPVRAFVRTEKYEYQPMSVVVNSEEMMDNLLVQARRDLKNFKEKYVLLEDTLEPVFNAIDKVGETK